MDLVVMDAWKREINGEETKIEDKGGGYNARSFLTFFTTGATETHSRPL